MSWKSFFESKWFIIGGVIVLILLCLGYGRAWYQEYQIQQEIATLENQAASLEAKKISTLDELSYVKSNAYVEAKARTELNLAKEGEHMVVVDQGDKTALAHATDAVVQSQPRSNPARWLRYFIH